MTERSEAGTSDSAAAVELTEEIAPKWEFIGARLLLFQFHEELEREMRHRKIKNFYEKLQYLTKEKLYGSYILESYTRNRYCRQRLC